MMLLIVKTPPCWNSILLDNINPSFRSDAIQPLEKRGKGELLSVFTAWVHSDQCIRVVLHLCTKTGYRSQ